MNRKCIKVSTDFCHQRCSLFCRAGELTDPMHHIQCRWQVMNITYPDRIMPGKLIDLLLHIFFFICNDEIGPKLMDDIRLNRLGAAYACFSLEPGGGVNTEFSDAHNLMV